MTRVRLDDGPWLELAAGERLLDAIDLQEAVSLPTSCRGATCGSCLVKVAAGASLLEPAASDEQRTLVALGCRLDARLACQIVVRDHGDVELRRMSR